MSAPLLEARGVTKAFGGLQALDAVDLQVGHGEIVGLIGPNGSGKSTLLNCLGRALPVDAGAILLEGADITTVAPYRTARLGLTRTFQEIRIFHELPVWENALLGRQWGDVRLSRLVRRSDRATGERARDLLDLVGLTPLRDDYAGNLSGGQRRLLELVMAMMPRPRLVMLDEATSGVNPTLIEHLRRYLLVLHDEEQVSYLMVEHNTGFIFGMAERIVVLHQGREMANGTPEQIRDDPEVIDAYLGA